MFLLYNSIFYAVVLFLTIVGFSNGPQVPINKQSHKAPIADSDFEGVNTYEALPNAELEVDKEKVSLGKQICWILKDPLLVLWMVIFAIGLGCLCTLSSILAALLIPFDIASWVNGVAFFGVLFGGLASSSLYSLFLLRKPNQIFYLLVIFIGNFICLYGFCVRFEKCGIGNSIRLYIWDFITKYCSNSTRPNFTVMSR